MQRRKGDGRREEGESRGREERKGERKEREKQEKKELYLNHMHFDCKCTANTCFTTPPRHNKVKLHHTAPTCTCKEGVQLQRCISLPLLSVVVSRVEGGSGDADVSSLNSVYLVPRQVERKWQ